MFFDSEKILEQIWENFSNFIQKDEKITIAVSGGVDSLFLSIAIVSYIRNYNLDFEDFYFIIIDHKLREISTSQCLETKRNLEKFGLQNVHILTWQHDEIKSNIEDEARNARYELLINFCHSHHIKKILLGHHLDDQIETFFMNVFRGSGTLGLGCMQEVSYKNNIQIIRPMLQIRKDKIINFMQNNDIYWTEDDTNCDNKFTRNKIRNILAKVGLDDIIANRIYDTINCIQDLNGMIMDDIDNILKSQHCLKNENNVIIKIDFFKTLHHQRKIYFIYQIYKILSFNNKPRFQQISDLISIISSFNSENKDIRKLYLSDLNIAISNQEIIFSKINN